MGLVFLGTLALVSAVIAVVAALTAGTPKQTSTRRTGNPLPAQSASGSPAPTVTVTVESTNPDEGGGYNTGSGGGGQQNGPSIEYFRLSQAPKCPTGHSSTQAVVEWKVSGGATGVALSVDNPGLVGSYKSYQGTSGSDTLPFSCGGAAPGSTVKHVYTIYTTGGGPQRSSTINATAKVGGTVTNPSGKPGDPKPSASAKY
jgi:hypothetical protein